MCRRRGRFVAQTARPGAEVLQGDLVEAFLAFILLKDFCAIHSPPGVIRFRSEFPHVFTLFIFFLAGFAAVFFDQFSVERKITQEQSFFYILAFRIPDICWEAFVLSFTCWFLAPSPASAAHLGARFARYFDAAGEFSPLFGN